MNAYSLQQTTTASYGTWNSPISAEKVAEGEASVLNMMIDNNTTYWSEMRPQNLGRYTIVKRLKDGTIQDVTPPDFNARTFVHEMGGGAFTVAEGVVYASNGADGAIYRIESGKTPERITQGQTKVNIDGVPKWQGTRFADLQHTQYGIVAIGEKHEPGKPEDNFLALIDIKTGSYKKLASGYDFYSSPAISNDQKKIAWICWSHPNMPWADTELWMADFDANGQLKNTKQIAGDISESIFQPQWSPKGELYFVTDRNSGWWNLHRYQNGNIANICPIDAEVAEPLWIFGKSTYAFIGNKIAFTFNSEGTWKLGIADPDTKRWQKIERNSVTIQLIRSGNDFVQFFEGFSDEPQALVQLDIAPGYPIKTLYAKKNFLEKGDISIPQHIAFPSSERTAFAYYYPPTNKNFKAPQGEKPPLVVMIHGGPTAQAKNSFQLKMQYWTSRGFAVLDVNYGGSTGYGRVYRQLLDNSWGIVDVEDCVNGALFLARQGLVDIDKLVIRGGSAGGYTTLAALAFTNVFKAGASYYGVADITALAKDTHKFEKRYMEQLVGKYPEEKKIWEERSPINSVNNIKSPLIIFQGENDTIVPVNQSIMIYEALKKRGIPVEITIYPGEEHGFRQTSHIVDSITKEKDFYLKVFGLDQENKGSE